MARPFDTLLVANRGEIAVRVLRAAHALGLRTVAVYGVADLHAAHVALADQAVCIGDEREGVPYLDIAALIGAAVATGAEAIHPGYGFLAERADFARAVIDAGLVWVGPPPAAMVAMAEKDTAKTRAAALGVPVVPGVQGRGLSDAQLAVEAERVGFPLLIKAVAGGGGRGMRVVQSADAVPVALQQARHEAATAFGDDALLLERYVARGRHVEVQVLCDQHGAAVHLFERECSVQRRHQKLVEESPSPGITPLVRETICGEAVRLVQAIDYVGAGTVEFLVDDDSGEHFFLEVNARIQVEHPVTERVTGVDLVQAQLRVAMGEPLPWAQADLTCTGHAVEVRLCAEDARDGHRPQAGPVHAWRPPSGVRVDSALQPCDVVPVHYDSMVAKLIAHGPDRATAVRTLRRALDETELHGVANNRAFLAAVLDHPAFRAGETTTNFLDVHDIAAPDDPIADGWLVAAALLRHGPSLVHRFRSNPSRADVTVLTRPTGDVAHVLLDPLGDGRWAFAVDHHPDPSLAAPPTPTGQAQVLASDEGWLRLQVDGHVQTYRVRDVGGHLWIQRPGHDAEPLTEGTLLPEPAPAALPAGAVVSPSAAMVTAVHVAPGQGVAAGEALVTVEAMKMLTVLRAPEAGIVDRVDCALGDNVSAGQVLVEVRVEDT